MINTNNDKIIEIDKTKTTYDDCDKLCLICMDMKGVIVLCSKCKYVYCAICAKKINKLCSICYRNKITNNTNYDYYNYYDELVMEPTFSQYFTVMASFTIATIIGFCWIVFFILFGFIGVVFLLKIMHYLMKFI